MNMYFFDFDRMSIFKHRYVSLSARISRTRKKKNTIYESSSDGLSPLNVLLPIWWRGFPLNHWNSDCASRISYRKSWYELRVSSSVDMAIDIP